MVKENKLNDLTGKEWLLFQKSWFPYQGKESLYLSHIRFFSKVESQTGVRIGSTVHSDQDVIAKLISEKSINVELITDKGAGGFQYIFIDLMDDYHLRPRTQLVSNEEYLIVLAELCLRTLKSGGYISVFARNLYKDSTKLALAFEAARVFKRYFTIRDERIACPIVLEDKSPIYCLNFRKEKK